jgi:hypothetical protein
MNTCRAVLKADALASHARYLGVPLNVFAVTLTTEEGFELIEYILEGGLGRFVDETQIEADALSAKAQGDPWIVLENISIYGFEILKCTVLH